MSVTPKFPGVGIVIANDIAEFTFDNSTGVYTADFTVDSVSICFKVNRLTSTKRYSDGGVIGPFDEDYCVDFGLS
jgi:hypothetical protein